MAVTSAKTVCTSSEDRTTGCQSSPALRDDQARPAMARRSGRVRCRDSGWPRPCYLRRLVAWRPWEDRYGRDSDRAAQQRVDAHRPHLRTAQARRLSRAAHRPAPSLHFLRGSPSRLRLEPRGRRRARSAVDQSGIRRALLPRHRSRRGDRKSTRLNSSHLVISYAVFCLKKKKKKYNKLILTKKKNK